MNPKTFRPRQRTRDQNAALHLGLTLIADSLNLAGLDMRKVLKPNIEIPWTTQSVKDHIFRPVMKAMTSKQSTTKLAKVGEIEEIWEVIMRHLGQNHGIEYIPFPNDPTKLQGATEETPYLDEV